MRHTNKLTAFELLEAKTAAKPIPGDVAEDDKGDSTTDPAETFKVDIQEFDRSVGGVFMVVTMLFTATVEIVTVFVHMTERQNVVTAMLQRSVVCISREPIKKSQTLGTVGFRLYDDGVHERTTTLHFVLLCSCHAVGRLCEPSRPQVTVALLIRAPCFSSHRPVDVYFFLSLSFPALNTRHMFLSFEGGGRSAHTWTRPTQWPP